MPEKVPDFPCAPIYCFILRFSSLCLMRRLQQVSLVCQLVWSRMRRRKGHCTLGGQCDQMWPNFATLARFKSIWWIVLRIYLVFGKILNIFWRICHTTGLVFIIVNGKNRANHLAVWSHCLAHNLEQFFLFFVLLQLKPWLSTFSND